MSLTIVRGYVNYSNGKQENFYFEKSAEAMASFIMEHTAEDTSIVIDNILGKTIISSKGSEPVKGRKSEVEMVQKCLDALRAGEKQAVSIQYIELQDINGVDEFESAEQEARAYVKLFDR